MSLLDKLNPYTWLIEAGIYVICAGIVWAAWVKHDHTQQAIGEQRCQARVEVAVQEANKAADDKYNQQLKERDSVIAQYQQDKDAQQHQHDLDAQQLHDYEDRLRAYSVQKPPATPGNPGTQVVGFPLESFKSFARTCADVAKDGQDDALALKMCKAYVDDISNASR